LGPSHLRSDLLYGDGLHVAPYWLRSVGKWTNHIGHTLDKQHMVGWPRFYGKLSTMLSWHGVTSVVLYVDVTI